MASLGAHVQRLSDVIQATRTTGGDYRDGDRIGHGPGQGEVITSLGAITIHGGEQDLSSPEASHPLGPLHNIEARVLAASLHIHIPAAGIATTGINGHDDALAAELIGPLSHQLRPPHRRGVETHLVGTGPQQLGNPFNGADATANRERNRDRFSCATHHVDQGAAPLMAGCDVEENEFIRPCPAVTASQLHWIAGIAQANEIDTFHHPSPGDIQARNQTQSNHRFGAKATVKVAPLSKPRRPCPRLTPFRSAPRFA